MHIERIHRMIECLTEKTLSELDKGIENVNVEEMSEAVDMIKDLCEAEYRAVIVKSMKKADEEEEEYNKELLRMLKTEYGEEDGRRFYDEYRYKTTGRYAPKGKGTYAGGRRGYDEPPFYHMTPDMYKMHDAEWYRDMDRADGKMYYTEPITMESRYDKAKRMYTETKANHNSGSVEDKQLTLKEGEKMLNVIIDELMEMVSDATPEMKNMIKTKGMSAMQKIQ